MTEDNKATRLSKAAREFNVGIPTIVEFLNKKGSTLIRILAQKFLKKLMLFWLRSTVATLR